MGPHPGRKLITLKAGAPAAPKKPPVRPLGPSDVAKARRVAQAEALAWLAETYPAAFGSVVRPLALGAGRLVWPEAKRRGIKRRALNAALKRHTGSLAYLDALAADGAMRFGLDGQPMGPLSAEHRAGAIEAMTKNACNQRSTAREA